MNYRGIHGAVEVIFSAPVFPLFILPLFAYLPERTGELTALQSTITGWIYIGFVPLLVLVYAKKTGISEKFTVPKRENRTPIFLAVVLSYTVSTVIFWHHSAHDMFMISLAYVFVTSSMALINLFWKISIHASGISGPTTALVYSFGPVFLPLYLLLIPVCINRHRLDAHTKGQLLAGSFLPVLLTYLLYLGLY